jgi:uncharacterized protein YqjF (DUF2071 family)
MKGRSPHVSDRLHLRERPTGSPIMHQSWGKLLFMHWQTPIHSIRRLIPERLTVDTFDGEAWISLTPFTIWDARPIFTPPLPWLSDFHEINVRTYVSLGGVPGVWFFSLDANSMVAVMAARAFFHLPYYNASISLEQEGETVFYNSTREDAGPPARFNATWIIGSDLPQARPGSLDYFLVERYCLYTSDGGKLYRCRIFHQPWPLQEASLTTYDSSMIEAGGLPTPEGEPLLHCGGPVNVEVWPLEEV